MANCYDELGREDQARALRREVYAGSLRLHGPSSEITINSANNLALSLENAEAKSLMRKNSSISRRSLGEDHIYTLRARSLLAGALLKEHDFHEWHEGVAIYEDVCRRSRRVFGESHPDTRIFQTNFDVAKKIVRLASVG